jgi:hypothetical protein
VVPSQPVDAVYTWVNPNDPQWVASYNQHVGGDRSAKRFNNGVRADAELQTSVELLLKNCPWVRTVHIATARPQVPSFLEKEAWGRELVAKGKVRVVHHDEFFHKPEALPVFNSHAIEANLHRIPNLAPLWLYLNDDMMVSKPQRPSAFFHGDKPVVRGLWMPVYFGGNNKAFWDEHVSACVNGGRALGHLWYFHNDHNVSAMSTRAAEAASLQLGDTWTRTASARLRDHDQIVPVGVVENHALNTGAYVRHKKSPLKSYAMLYSLMTPRSVNKLASKDLYCVNNIPAAKVEAVMNRIRARHGLSSL